MTVVDVTRVKHLRQALMVFLTLFLQPLAALSAERNDRLAAEIEILSESIVLDEKYVLKTLSPAESGLPEEYLRRIVNETEAALLTASDFRILLQNRYTTEDIWAEAVEFGDANFDDLYKASRADFLILVSPRTLENDVELNIQIIELAGEASGRVIRSTGYFDLGVKLDQEIGVNYDFLAEKVQIEIRRELEEIDQQIALLEFLRNDGVNDTSLDQRLVRLIQDKRAFLIDANRTYKVTIEPEEIPNIGLSQAVFIPLRVPYFTSQVGSTFHDTLPSSELLTEGYMTLEPGIDDHGKFDLVLSFTQNPKGIAAVDTKLLLSEREIRDLASAIELMSEWDSIARERQINRNFAKAGYCVPQTDPCPAAFTWVLYETADEPESGRVVEFNRGNAAYSYSFKTSAFDVIAAYLEFLDRRGISEFLKQMTDENGLVTFK